VRVRTDDHNRLSVIGRGVMVRDVEPIAIARPAIGDLEVAAVTAVLRSGSLVQGSEVAAFESEFSALVAGRHCIAVASGTSALHLALSAIGVGPGDEVIVPSFTFAATAHAVSMAGARPVFADVREDDFCLDAADVESRIGPRTVAVVAVHLYGQPGDVDALAAVCRRHGVALVEDAAQAHAAGYEGRPAGSLGVGAAFSFYATKNMTTGEGGMVVVEDEAVARRVRLLRNQGMLGSYHHEVVGQNARMTDMAAAMGRVQLRRLPDLNAARRDNAHAYADALPAAVCAPVEHPGRCHAWHLYTVRVAGRDAVAARLTGQGIQTGVYYRVPVHRQPSYDDRSELPVTDRLAADVLSLPVHPGVGRPGVERVVAALQQAVL
jgi:dTDP-4-amino-4,6-dideoxygalactose transaminase